MLKKVTLLTALSVAALASVGTAAASAEMFFDNGSEIGAGGVNESYSGNFKWTGGNGSGIECEMVHAAVTFTTEEAHVTSFAQEECETFGPLNTVLNCHTEGNPVSENLPWTITFSATAGTLEVHKPKISQRIAAGCGFPGFAGGGTLVIEESATGSVHFAVTSQPFVNTLSLAGNGSTSFGAITISGSLSADNNGETVSIE